MPKAYSAAAAAANSGGAETCTVWQKNCTASPLQMAVTDIVKRKKPSGTKAWAFLADLFGIKERSAKSRLSNTVSYTIDELQALIHGEDGLETSRPLWPTLSRNGGDGHGGRSSRAS